MGEAARAADGRLVLIDVFCMDGALLYRKILEDLAGVHRRIPRERMRYALDIPYIARENSTAEIFALRKAWARAAGLPLAGLPGNSRRCSEPLPDTRSAGRRDGCVRSACAEAACPADRPGRRGMP